MRLYGCVHNHLNVRGHSNVACMYTHAHGLITKCLQVTDEQRTASSFMLLTYTCTVTAGSSAHDTSGKLGSNKSVTGGRVSAQGPLGRRMFLQGQVVSISARARENSIKAKTDATPWRRTLGQTGKTVRPAGLEKVRFLWLLVNRSIFRFPCLILAII